MRYGTPAPPEPVWPEAPVYCAQRPRPSYTFTRGHPHPTRDPRGHSFGVPENVQPIDPADWMASQDYLYAIDLYHEGYFWGAHEAWEGLWHAAGRDTTAHGRLLRALIRLTAACLKLRAGTSRGAWQHSLGAHALLGQVQAMLDPCPAWYMGLHLDGLRREIAHHFGPIWASEGRVLDTLDAPPRLRLASSPK